MKCILIKKPKDLTKHSEIINHECEEHGGSCCASGYCCERDTNRT